MSFQFLVSFGIYWFHSEIGFLIYHGDNNWTIVVIIDSKMRIFDGASFFFVCGPKENVYERRWHNWQLKVRHRGERLSKRPFVRQGKQSLFCSCLKIEQKGWKNPFGIFFFFFFLFFFSCDPIGDHNPNLLRHPLSGCHTKRQVTL